MMRWLPLLAGMAAIACALVAGFFQSFSEVVMVSLDRSMRAGGIEAMQTINREVFGTVFMVLLLGMSLAAPLAAGTAWFTLSGPPRTWLVLAGLSYFVGVFLVTLLGNVPMNTALSQLPFASPEAREYWEAVYFPRWTLWNHVRTLGAVSASLCFLLASHALQAKVLQP
jgi:uncharacterized membrane protein